MLAVHLFFYAVLFSAYAMGNPVELQQRGNLPPGYGCHKKSKLDSVRLLPPARVDTTDR